MENLLPLFLSFFKIGSFTFGGGYAMLPIIQREIVQRHQWISDEELTDYFAMGQVTPGVFAVNAATFVGYKVAGLLGALVATFGVILTPVMLITCLASVLLQLSDSTLVKHALSGIKAGVIVLILDAIIILIQKNITDKATIAIFLLVIILSLLLSLSPILIVLAVALLGALTFSLKGGPHAS